MIRITIQTVGTGNYKKLGQGSYNAVLCTQVNGKDYSRAVTGSFEKTHLDALEIQAATDALRLIRKPSSVTVVTESGFLQEAFKEASYAKDNLWLLKKNGKPLAFSCLWETLFLVIKEKQLDVIFTSPAMEQARMSMPEVVEA